jgi:hypothetical protein
MKSLEELVSERKDSKVSVKKQLKKACQSNEKDYVKAVIESLTQKEGERWNLQDIKEIKVNSAVFEYLVEEQRKKSIENSNRINYELINQCVKVMPYCCTPAFEYLEKTINEEIARAKKLILGN